MKSLKFLLVLGLPQLASAAQALTVDEVIRLKRAGVSDSTIELMLKGRRRLALDGRVENQGWLDRAHDRNA